MSVQNIKIFHTPFFLLITIGFFFFSCEKEKIDVISQELNSGTTENLSAIQFTSDGIAHVVGGNIWFSGIYLQSNDQGVSWTVDNFSDKQLFGLHFNGLDIGHTVGIDGYLFRTNQAPYQAWDFYRLPRWDILRDVCFNDKNEGVLVGGIAFAQGAITVVDSNYAVQHIDTFENQLNTVCYSDDQTIHVAGYGLILRSDDGGATWIENTLSGDFFQSITFPTPSIGFMVGYNGTILKTTDTGLNWSKLRDGDAIGVSDQPFTTVHFETEEYGYIVGEGGLCWRTEDGGDNWDIIGGLPNFDYSDIDVSNGMVYIVGEDGRIIRFEEE